jgi:tRNA nucleotidyltransferase (CCA-adding enzyme)
MNPLALELARGARDAGGRALVVGGWVRDRLLGRTSKDLDIEVFGVPADRLLVLLERLGRVDTVGESFTVYKLENIDVSLPRRDSKTGRGHKGFTVEGDPKLSYREAARRRDFTINAISQDPLTNELIDPFNGRGDLDARVLRAVDPVTFVEDSLRVLRALQFAARFELTVDDETKALCRSLPLDDLPSERIWGEIEKLLLQAERPSIGFTLALELGVIDRLFPEMKALVGCPQEHEWHPEGDVWIHTLMVIDEARRRIEGLDRGPAAAMMLGAISHDFGKPSTTAFSDGRIRSMGHEEAGVAPATALLDRLNVHTLRRSGRGVRPGRPPPQAERVSEGRDSRQRRRLSAAGSQSRPRITRPLCQGRLSRPRWRIRLLRDGLVHRARAGPGSRARGAEGHRSRPASD